MVKKIRDLKTRNTAGLCPLHSLVGFLVGPILFCFSFPYLKLFSVFPRSGRFSPLVMILKDSVEDVKDAQKTPGFEAWGLVLVCFYSATFTGISIASSLSSFSGFVSKYVGLNLPTNFVFM